MDAPRLREALRRQGIYVHEGDPVLEVAEIVRLAVAETVATIEGLNKATADRISAASAQHIDASRQAAATLITRSGEWSADRLRTAAQQATDDLLRQIRQETARAELAAQAAAQGARTSAHAAQINVMLVAIMGLGMAGFFVALDLGWF
jgi:hypothetical protein